MGFDFTVGKVRSLPLKVRTGTLNARWAWHMASSSALESDIVGPVKIERNGAKRIMKVFSREFCISRLLH